MRRNTPKDRWLAAGLGLFAACLLLNRSFPAGGSPWIHFLSGALAGLSLLLIWVSILRGTRWGRALLARARRFKGRLLGRGA